MKFRPNTFITVPNKDVLKGKDPYLQNVFMWICSYIDENGMCFPSRNRLAEDSGVSVRTLDKYINELVELNLIVKEKRAQEGNYLSNRYWVNIVEVVQMTTLPPANDDTTPSASYDTLTKSILLTKSINNTVEEEKPEIDQKLGFPTPDGWYGDYEGGDSETNAVWIWRDENGKKVTQGEISRRKRNYGMLSQKYTNTPVETKQWNNQGYTGNQFKPKKQVNLTIQDLKDFVNKAWNANLVASNKVNCLNTTVYRQLLPQVKKITPDMEESWLKIGEQYTKQDVVDSLTAYIKEICNRNIRNDYAKHRFTCYEFLTNKKGFYKYNNL